MDFLAMEQTAYALQQNHTGQIVAAYENIYDQ